MMEIKITTKQNEKWGVKYRGKKVKRGGGTRTILFRLVGKKSIIYFFILFHYTFVEGKCEAVSEMISCMTSCEVPMEFY